MAALKNAKAKNKRLGYGSDEKNYEKEQYDRDRRILMQKTRIAKGKKTAGRPAKNVVSLGLLR